MGQVLQGSVRTIAAVHDRVVCDGLSCGSSAGHMEWDVFQAVFEHMSGCRLLSVVAPTYIIKKRPDIAVEPIAPFGLHPMAGLTIDNEV